MPKKNLKRAVCIAIAAVLLCGVIAGGLLGLKKAYGLYWDLRNTVNKRADHTVAYFEQLVQDSYLINRSWVTHIENAMKIPHSFDYSWVEAAAGPLPRAALIAHAFGGINGNVYTNSLEAFQENYALGHRVFEVDFDLTEDEYYLIASHDEEKWREAVGQSEDIPYTIDNFLHPDFETRYTMMGYRDIVELMSEYPDIYIVTDTKYTDYESVLLQFSQLVRYANLTHPEVLERIIPQIYHESMLDWVLSVYPFRSIIFTLYATTWTPDSVYDFCERSGVRFVTLWNSLVTPEILKKWDQLGILTATHTVNDIDDAKRSLDMGVDLIYTDFLTPADIASLL